MEDYGVPLFDRPKEPSYIRPEFNIVEPIKSDSTTARFDALLATAFENTYSPVSEDVMFNFETAYARAMADPDGLNIELGNKYRSAMTNEAESMTKDGTLNYEDLGAVVDAINKDAGSRTFNKDEAIAALAKDRNEENQRKLKVSAMANEYLKELANKDNASFGDKTWNILAQVVPFRNQAFSEEMFNKLDVSQGSYQNFLDNFRAATPEKQAEIMDAVVNKMKTTDGYVYEKFGMIEAMIGNAANEAVFMNKVGVLADLAFTAGDLVTIGKVASKLAGNVSVPKALANAGRADEAAAVVGSAATDPNVSRLVGIDPVDAVATIFKTDSVSEPLGVKADDVVNQITGGAVVTADNVDAYRRRIQKDLSDFEVIKPEMFTAKEVDEAVSTFAANKVKEVEKITSLRGTGQPNIQIVDVDGGKVKIKLGYSVEGSVPAVRPNASKVPKETYDAAVALTKTEPNITLKGLQESLGVSRGTAKMIMDDLSETGFLTKQDKQGRRQPIADAKHAEVNKKLDYEEEYTVDLTLGDIGKFEDTRKTDATLTAFLGSPKYMLESAARKSGATVNNLVEGAGIVLENQHRLQNKLADGFSEAIKGADIPKLNKLLEEHDKAGKVLDINELASMGADANTIQSYYKLNSFQDIVKDLHEFSRYNVERMRGTQEISIAEELRLGKSFSSTEGAAKQAGLPSLDEIWDTSTGKLISDTAEIKRLLDDNERKIFVATEDMVTDAGARFRAVLVEPNLAKPVSPSSVRIGTVAGYVPIIRPDAKYFVKVEEAVKVNGVNTTRVVTHGAGSTRKEAEKILQDLKDELEKTGDTTKTILPIKYDREGIVADVGQGGGSGGLFTGHRSSRDIIWEGTAGKRLAPLEAIGRNLEAVSKAIPMNEWKMAMIKRWENSVRQSDVQQAKNLSVSLHDPIDISTPAGRILEAQRRYLASIVGIPEESAKIWEGFVRSVSEKLDVLSPASGRALRRSTANPLTFLKSLAFSTMLGWFNPAQLFVQAANMAIVAAIHPMATAKNLHKVMALRAVLYARTDDQVRALASKVGISPDELVELRRAFKLAGGDNIKTNADYDAAAMGFSTNANAMARAYGATKDGISKLNETGLIFYRQGELASRTTAFTVAFDVYKSKNGIKGELTKAQLREVVSDYKNMMLNLGRENKAFFQKGVMSVTTQFWQVQAKFIESMFGGKFTTSEKLRLLLGSGVIFGAAGLPAGTMLAEVWGNMNRNEEGGYDGAVPEEVIKQGLLGFLFDGKLDLASRGGIANGLTDSWMSLFKDTDEPLWSQMMGASGTLLQRGSYAYNITKAFSLSDEKLPEQDFLDVLAAWGGIFSSFSNAEQAYMAYKLEKFQNKNNGLIMWEAPDNIELIGKALGFQPTRTNRMYEVGLDLKKRENFKKKAVDRFMQQMYATHIDVRSYEFSDLLRKNVQAFSMIVAGDDPWEQQEIQKAIWERIVSADTKEDKQLQDAVTNSLSKDLSAYTVQKGLQSYEDVR